MDQAVSNQLWVNSSVPLKCQSGWNPLVDPAAHLNNIFVSVGFRELPVWNICTLSPG